MAMSAYLEGELLDRIFLQEPFTIPSTFDLALFSTVQDDTGTNGVELSGSGYARKSISLNTTNWTVTDGAVTNAVAITTANATATWAEIDGWGLYSGSNLWFHGALTTPVTVTSGNAFSFGVGDLDITFGGSLTTARADIIGEAIFRAQSITWPTRFELALASTAPTASAAGTELSGNGYARGSIACNGTNWVRVDSRMANAINFEMGTAAPAAWLDVDGVDIYDQAGARWFYIAFAAPRPVAANNEARFVADELGFTAD